MKETKIIVALETKDSINIAPKIIKYVDGFKINHLFWSEITHWPDRAFNGSFKSFKNKELFVDFKLWDTPNTVKQVLQKIVDKGATMTTISTFNNEAVFDVAQEYAEQIKLLAVTYLTSWNPEEQRQIAKDMPYNMWRDHIARIRHKGFKGIICSPLDIVQIKHEDFMHDLYRVCPGIKYESELKGQSRTTTPKEAQELGADYLVIGRSITEASDPIKTVKEIYDSLHS